MALSSNIVFFIQSSGRYELRRLRGFYSFAQTRGWQVCVIDRRQQDAALGSLVRFWRPFGCVVEGIGAVEPNTLHELGDLPTVLCDETPERRECEKWRRNAVFVRHDSAASAVCAAKVLLKSRRKSYAYVGTLDRTVWSAERQKAFMDFVGGCGEGVSSFTFDGDGPFRDVVQYQEKLKAWIRRLPKPCAILAANDFVGTLVIAACRDMRVAIPEQVSLIGIDNDELCCENQRPTLSSVEPDFEEAGRLSGELLEQLAAGAAAPGCYRDFGPLRVVERQSTAITGIKNKSVLKALERIRLEACGSLKAADVLKAMGGARSRAERLFRAATGASVLEKIEERRLEEACALLRHKDVKVDVIANLCGYKSGSFLRKRFKEKFGVSMTAWRDHCCRGVASGDGLDGGPDRC